MMKMNENRKSMDSNYVRCMENEMKFIYKTKTKSDSIDCDGGRSNHKKSCTYSHCICAIHCVSAFTRVGHNPYVEEFRSLELEIRFFPLLQDFSFSEWGFCSSKLSD